MGLDSIELLLDVEDHYKVSLSDDECAQVRTVADLASLVIAHLPPASTACRSARRFFAIRGSVAAAGALDAGDIRPKTALNGAFPKRHRRVEWLRLRAQDPVIPALTLSPASRSAIAGVWIIGALACFSMSAFLWSTTGWLPGISAAIAAVALGGISLRLARNRLAMCFPAGCATFGDLVRLTLSPEEVSALRDEKTALERRVLDVIRRMTSEQMAVPLERVSAETRFVEDLGMS